MEFSERDDLELIISEIMNGTAIEKLTSMESVH